MTEKKTTGKLHPLWKLFASGWKLFASVKLTIALLLILAITSAIGTMIPQNANHAWYLAKYGKILYLVFLTFNIFDMYHSFWFRFLILALTANIIVCSINRLSSAWKIIFDKHPKFNLSRFQKLPEKEEFSTGGHADSLVKNCETMIKRGFSFYRIEQQDNRSLIFAEKGRWTRLGVYIVHFSVVLLLTGSLIGSLFGFEGYVNILEGETAKSITLRDTGKEYPLDFDIRCDDFNVSFYESGKPSEYRSSLSIVENNKIVIKKNIFVNRPLHHKGINIFQSSYGTRPYNFKVTFESRASGMVYTWEGALGESYEIPETLGNFQLTNFFNSYKFHTHDLGKCVIGTLMKADKEPVDVLMPLKYPSFDRMRKGDVFISISDFQSKDYTGLQVTRDPGVPLVYTGFLLIIIGCYITFFMSHQRLCIDIHDDGDTCRVVVSGFANKNRLGMKNLIRKISKSLEKMSTVKS